jgi:head-tail adaptor
MFMGAGEFDRSVTFQSKTAATDAALGTPKKGGWANYAEGVPAKVKPVLSMRSERLVGSVDMRLRPVRIVVRYRADITGEMRVLYEGRTLEIVAGPEEMGRRVGLEMIAQEFSTTGDAGQ